MEKKHKIKFWFIKLNFCIITKFSANLIKSYNIMLFFELWHRSQVSWDTKEVSVNFIQLRKCDPSESQKLLLWQKLAVLVALPDNRLKSILSSNFCNSKAHIFWEGPKFCEISIFLLSTVHTEKSKVDILQNFMAF